MSGRQELPVVPDDQCGTCRFWEVMFTGYLPDGEYAPGSALDPLDLDNSPWGFCRRYPPTFSGGDVQSAGAYTQPRTFNDQWCGEWQPTRGDSDRQAISQGLAYS